MLQKFQYKAEVMTTQPRKRGARRALYPPELERTPLPGFSFTQPPLDGLHCSTVKDAIPSSQFSPFLCKQTQQSQLCNELNWKSSMQTHVQANTTKLALQRTELEKQNAY